MSKTPRCFALSIPTAIAIAGVAVGVGIAPSAHAMTACTELTCNAPVYYCPPARFTNVHNGDVIAVLAPPEGESILGDVLRAVGMKYVHVAIVSNDAGTTVSQSAWDGSTPTGLYGCAQPLNPSWLSNLPPGVTNNIAVDDYGGLAMVLAGAGNPSCTGAADSYHVFGFANPLPNGTCSEFLRASCGVAVDQTMTVVSSLNLEAGAQELYNRIYSLVLTEIEDTSGSWGLALKCGGAGAHTEADRAANQVVNEFLHKGGAGSACADYGDGCDDYNACGWTSSAPSPCTAPFSTAGAHPASHPQAIVDTFVSKGGTPVAAGYVAPGACTCIENCP